MMDEAEVNYRRKTIIQASHLKRQIESLLGIRKDRHTIFSLDIKAFYPSVTYGLAERAIAFSPFCLKKKKAKIKVCLEMIAFGMGNTANICR
jgi:hypothetical protein